MDIDKLPSIYILDTKINRLTMPAALQTVEKLVGDKANHYIVTPNPEMLMYARDHQWFRDILNQASLSLADGAGIVWAAKYLSLSLIRIPGIKQVQELIQYLFTGAASLFFPKYLNVVPERITGADMVWEISKLAAKRDWKVFLLGAGPGVALKAAQIMQQMYPKLNVVEVMVGPPYETEDEVIRVIKQTKPQIIFLAFPAAGQMKWIRDQLPKLDNTVVMGIGGALDFIAGTAAINAEATSENPARRAPVWMQQHSLEWLWRLITQPWRKDRVKTALIKFMTVVRRAKLSGNYETSN